MKQRIYIDTSEVGGYFDEEFKEATRLLFDRLEKNEIIFVVSGLLDLELMRKTRDKISFETKGMRLAELKFKESKFKPVGQ